MNVSSIDTSVIIRLVTGDDPQKQARSREPFQRIEQETFIAAVPTTVIADAVFVLSSPRLYNRRRQEVAALLAPLIRLPGFRMQGRRAVLMALHFYATTPRLDFGDALLAAVARQTNSPTIYSYDTDFAQVPGVTRQEPC